MSPMIKRSWPFLLVVVAMFAWLALIGLGQAFNVLTPEQAAGSYQSVMMRYLPLFSFFTGVILGVTHGWEWRVTLTVILTALGLSVVSSIWINADSYLGALGIAVSYCIGFLIVFMIGNLGGVFARWATSWGKK